MKRSRLWASLLGIVFVSASLLVLNLALGNTPVLGLDLRGGVSVILASTEGAGDEDLIVIRDLIRDELEQRGIAEPDVRVEGSNVIVDLPGVKDQQDALDAVDIAGIVSLRPVLQCAVTGDTSTTVGDGSAAASTTPGDDRPSLRRDHRADAHRHRDRGDPRRVPRGRLRPMHRAPRRRRPRPPRSRAPTSPRPPPRHRQPPRRRSAIRTTPRRPGNKRCCRCAATPGEVCIVGPSGGIGRGVRAGERRAVARSGRRLGRDR